MKSTALLLTALVQLSVLAYGYGSACNFTASFSFIRSLDLHHETRSEIAIDYTTPNASESSIASLNLICNFTVITDSYLLLEFNCNQMKYLGNESSAVGQVYHYQSACSNNHTDVIEMRYQTGTACSVHVNNTLLSCTGETIAKLRSIVKIQPVRNLTFESLNSTSINVTFDDSYRYKGSTLKAFVNANLSYDIILEHESGMRKEYRKVNGAKRRASYWVQISDLKPCINYSLSVGGYIPQSKFGPRTGPGSSINFQIDYPRDKVMVYFAMLLMCDNVDSTYSSSDGSCLRLYIGADECTKNVEVNINGNKELFELSASSNQFIQELNVLMPLEPERVFSVGLIGASDKGVNTLLSPSVYSVSTLVAPLQFQSFAAQLNSLNVVEYFLVLRRFDADCRTASDVSSKWTQIDLVIDCIYILGTRTLIKRDCFVQRDVACWSDVYQTRFSINISRFIQGDAFLRKKFKITELATQSRFGAQVRAVFGAHSDSKLASNYSSVLVGSDDDQFTSGLYFGKLCTFIIDDKRKKQVDFQIVQENDRYVAKWTDNSCQTVLITEYLLYSAEASQDKYSWTARPIYSEEAFIANKSRNDKQDYAVPLNIASHVASIKLLLKGRNSKGQLVILGAHERFCGEIVPFKLIFTVTLSCAILVSVLSCVLYNHYRKIHHHKLEKQRVTRANTDSIETNTYYYSPAAVIPDVTVHRNYDDE